jgi:hypothetical protein
VASQQVQPPYNCQGTYYRQHCDPPEEHSQYPLTPSSLPSIATRTLPAVGLLLTRYIEPKWQGFPDGVALIEYA